MSDLNDNPELGKAERRERKLQKRRHGMQVSGRSVKTLLLTLQRPVGARKRRAKRKNKK